MPIEDSLKYRLQRETGDTAPTNQVDGTGEWTGGTISQVDVGGVPAWRFAGRATCTGQSGTSFGNATGTGCTIAVRLKVSGPVAFDYVAGVSAGTTGQRPTLQVKGDETSKYTARHSNASSTFIYGVAETANVRTIVLRAEANDPGYEQLSIWVDTASRVGTDPDHTRTGYSLVWSTWDRAFLGGDSTSVDVLDFVVWNRELSDAEAAAVADDIRSQLPVAGSSTPISFSGTVPDLAATQNVAISSVDLSTYFSGTQTPFTFSVQSGALPTGLSLSSAGVLSGTPTALGTASIVVRGTDDNSDTADTNSFDITVSAAVTPISFSGPVPDQEFTKDAAITDVDLSGYFSGTETPFTFAVQSGVLPNGLTLSSAGVLSGTPTAAGSATIVVRGTDDGSDTADTNSFDITVSEPDGTLTFTSSHALKNNTGTVLASETGIRLHILNAATLASVLELTGQTTNASGILSAVTSAALTPSTSYIVAVRLSDGSAGLSDPITAT